MRNDIRKQLGYRPEEYRKHESDSRTVFILMSFIIVGLIVGIAYLYFLNVGCEYTGVITWEGKQCFEDLPSTL